MGRYINDQNERLRLGWADESGLRSVQSSWTNYFR